MKANIEALVRDKSTSAFPFVSPSVTKLKLPRQKFSTFFSIALVSP